VGKDNSDTTFSGSISGTGGTNGLSKEGTGTLTLSGLSNLGNGSATANGGTLQISDGGSLKNAVSRIGYAPSKVGTVTVTGAGSSWTNTNFYVGSNGTGTLNIENGGLVSSGDGYIAYGSVSLGKVTVNGAGSSWKISSDLEVGKGGDGTLIVENGGSVSATIVSIGDSTGGSGTLNLDGTSGARGLLTASYIKRGAGSAVFAFDGGILQAKGNQSNFIRSLAAGSIAVNGGGAFIDTQAFDVGITTGGLFTGTGGLTKQGSGTLSIAGSNTYDGNTTVEGGILQFDSYTQSASQTLGISASSNTGYGKLAVTNTATFDADAKISVDVAGVNTLARGHLLTSVISAGTLTSTTFDVSDNSALLNFDAIRNGNAVDLHVASNSVTGIREAVINSGATATLGAADVLDNTLNKGATGDMANVVTALGKLATDSEVSQAATQTLPLLNSGVTQVTKGTLRLINRLLQNRQAVTSSGLSGGDAISNRAAWLQPFGSSINQDDRDGAAGFDATTWGMAGGLEGDLDRSTRIGIAYAYANSNVDGNTTLSGTKQHADIDSHVLALYGTKQLANNMAWMWQADVGQNSNSGVRHLNFGGLDRTATSDHQTYTAHVGASLEKTLVLSERTSVTSTLRADYTWLRADSYREKGANALNLNVAQQTNDALVIGVDARISHMLTTYSWIEANAGVGYDAINKVGNVVATYAGTPGQSFATQGIDHSPWLFAGGLAYVHNTASGTEISVRYDVEGRRDYVNQSASIKAKWLF
tara:strand:- start:294611 stop:296890 length:2280 start_codon:yes stop_codon:yes gene_type:complete